MSGCAWGHVLYGVPLQGIAGPSPTFLCPQRTWLAQAPLHSHRMGVRGSSAPVHGTCQPRGRPRHTWASGKASGFPRGDCTASTPRPTGSQPGEQGVGSPMFPAVGADRAPVAPVITPGPVLVSRRTCQPLAEKKSKESRLQKQGD